MSIEDDSGRDTLIKSLRETAGSRFNASKRLERRDRHLAWVTAFTSSYIIFLTILPYINHIPLPISENLSLAVMFLSIIILVSALLHNASRDAVNAEQLHRSALEINELYRRLMGQPDTNFGELANQYNMVLQKYSVNHDEIDYLLYQLQRPEEYPWRKPHMRAALRIRLACVSNIPLIFLLAITLGVLWLVCAYALPARL